MPTAPIAVVTAVCLVLAACASQPADPAAVAKAADKGDRSKASELYAGQPAVVHATEFPVDSAEDGLRRGDEAWRLGKLDLAVYLYVQSLAFDATRAAPFVRIGRVHEQLGNAALAAKAYEFALERNPDDAAVCERLGWLYLQAGNDARAQALLTKAVALEPKSATAHNGLGVLADRRKEPAAAVAHYDSALAIDPKVASVFNNRGYSRFLAGDFAGAERDLREAIALGVGSGAWLNLGRVQASQRRYVEALECFTRATDQANAYNLLGEVAVGNGDYERARRYFESAISAAPRYFEGAQRNLAVVNERLASPGSASVAADAAAVRVVVAETNLYHDGKVVGVARRDDRVTVLETKQGRSRVRMRDPSSGTDLTGWLPVAALAAPP